MTLLCVTPDYFSHYVPLAAIATRWRAAGESVVVATGSSLKERVQADGFTHVECVLTPRSNPGILPSSQFDGGDGARLREDLDASRKGMVETLAHQAETRLADLLWEPYEVLGRLASILRDVQPRHVLSVQLAYNATAALLALRAPFISFVTGHPAQVPGPGELYGFPHVRPPRFETASAELEALASLCRHVQETFTRTFNRFLHDVDPDSAPVRNALAAGSRELVLHNYPPAMGEYRRPMLPPHARFVGAVIRDEQLDHASAEWLGRTESSIPIVLVAFGSVFSLRTDVLQRVTEAFRCGPFRVIIATGAADVGRLRVPADWYAGAHLPQVALLRHCDLVVTHGGNNTMMEALSAGVPLLAGPFSSDQFAGAADVERQRLGAVFDPNHSTPGEILSLAQRALSARDRARHLGRQLRSAPGADEARRQILAAFPE
jgi:zeaxanthin glucosyltransferase